MQVQYKNTVDDLVATSFHVSRLLTDSEKMGRWERWLRAIGSFLVLVLIGFALEEVGDWISFFVPRSGIGCGFPFLAVLSPVVGGNVSQP